MTQDIWKYVAKKSVLNENNFYSLDSSRIKADIPNVFIHRYDSFSENTQTVMKTKKKHWMGR